MSKRFLVNAVLFHLRPYFGFVLRNLEKLGIKPIKYEKMFHLKAHGVIPWRNEAELYNSYFITNKESFTFCAERLANIVKRYRPKSILELGCGPGFVLNVIRKTTVLGVWE